MSEFPARTLNHFTVFKLKDAYYQLDDGEREKSQGDFLGGVQGAAENTDLYQLYPASTKGDILVWCALEADEPQAAGKFFTTFAQATNPSRHLIEPVFTAVYPPAEETLKLWG